MLNLFVTPEILTNGFWHGTLDILSVLSILCGIFVIISNNPIVSVLFLIGLFFSIACYLLVLGLSFIGLSYLLVYVGAVSILFIFILMLINIRISELLSNSYNSIPLALLLAVCFNYPVYQILPESLMGFNLYSSTVIGITDNLWENLDTNFSNISNNSDDMSYVTTNMWDGSVAETIHITSIGNIMYTSYSIWLIITSIILLLAMVGAIVITIK